MQPETDREQVLDHQVVEVTGNPVPVLVDGQALLVPGGAAELDGECGVTREGVHHAHVSLGKRIRSPESDDGQHSEVVAGRGQGNQAPGPSKRPCGGAVGEIDCIMAALEA